MLGFRTRSPERDMQTDLRRKARLHAVLTALRDEVAGEKGALERRLEGAMADAAFAACAEENDDGTVAGRVETLGKEIINARARLGRLETQLTLLRSQLAQVSGW